jgi:hypothetical protein
MVSLAVLLSPGCSITGTKGHKIIGYVTKIKKVFLIKN